MSKRVQRVWNGKVIEGLKSVVMGRKKSAEVIACVNALLSWEVKSGQKTCGEIQIGDAKTTLLLPKGSGGGTNTANPGELTQMLIAHIHDDYLACVGGDSVNYNVAKPDEFRGAGVSINPPYLVNDLIYVAACDATGVTVSGQDLTNIDANVCGRNLGGYLKMMMIGGLYDDYLLCYESDGNTNGTTPYYVAKPWELRGSTVVCVGPYAVGDYIVAGGCDHTGVEVDSAELHLMDMNVCGRAPGRDLHWFDANDDCKEYHAYVVMSAPTLYTA